MKTAYRALVLLVAGLGLVAFGGCSGGNENTAFGGAAGADGGVGADASACGTGTARCGAICADLKLDPANCGTCGTQCAAGLVCTQGQCALRCAGGTTLCGARCVDTTVDPKNCGGCGATYACGADQVCSAGTCANVCTGGTLSCQGACIDPLTSATNCGAMAGCGADGGSAGSACAAGQVCSAGTCQLSCQAGLVKCGATCVDPLTSRTNCGAAAGCDLDAGTSGSACAAGQVCSAGTCQLSCQAGLVKCGTTCVDPFTSRTNCGATTGCGADAGSAGSACATGQVCSAGTCQLSCQAGLVKCGTTCVDPLTSRTNCGATAGCGADAGSAGSACATGQVCSAGTCQLSCQAGLVSCDATCIDPLTNRAHCGATAGCGADAGSAGSACATGEVCDAGTCQLSCQAGLVSCEAMCIDPLTNRTHCGATAGCGADAGSTGSACATGEVCDAGTCQLSCQAGLVSCDATCIDPLTNRAHCGATAGCGADAGSTGSACATGQVCSAGTCQLSCQAGLVSCEAMCIDPLTNRTHCGATAGCGADAGSAGSACATGEVCDAGTCQLSCQAGFIKCGTTCIDPNTDRQYCGAWGDCLAPIVPDAGPDADLDAGTDADLDAAVVDASTGSVGTACSAGQVCSAGTCQASCQADLVACGGLCIDPFNSQTNCGATAGCGVGGGTAGTACSGGTTCTQGVCEDVKCTTPLHRSATATISAGGSGGPYVPAVMNDGVGKTCSSWAWVSNGTTPAGVWAQLTWATPQNIDSFYVETVTAAAPECGSVRNIASATIQWWDGAAWRTTTTLSNQPGDIFFTFPSTVTTTAIRMYDITSAGFNSIIWEWHVYQNVPCP